MKRCRVWPGAAVRVVYLRSGRVRERDTWADGVALAWRLCWLRLVGRIGDAIEQEVGATLRGVFGVTRDGS